ncbi:unnamed protein product, partial [Discosporangium mesarthrocarpum]
RGAIHRTKERESRSPGRRSTKVSYMSGREWEEGIVSKNTIEALARTAGLVKGRHWRGVESQRGTTFMPNCSHDSGISDWFSTVGVDPNSLPEALAQELLRHVVKEGDVGLLGTRPSTVFVRGLCIRVRNWE